jgi:hypothetical protein
LNIAIEIPLPVLQELESNWIERTKAERHGLKRSLKNMGALVGNPELANVLPEWTDVENAFHATVRSLLHKWSIATTPFTTIPTTSLFVQAIQKQLVFGEKGVNFQDAIILHSVIERLTSTSDIGALISEDGIFHKRYGDWQVTAEGCNTDLKPLRVKDIEEHLLERFNEADRKRILDQKELALKALNAFLPTFQHVFNEHLKSSPLEDLRDFVSGQLIDVDVTQLPPNPSIGTAVRVSAKVRGTVKETTRHYPEPYRGTHVEENRIKPLEVGFTANATYEGDSYKVLDVHSMTFGMSG